jgi:hypothetical protein
VNRIRVLFTVALALALSATVLGQRGTAALPGIPERTIGWDQMTVVSGTLTGTVRDQSRALVSGIQVTVTLETDANVEPHRTTTDQEGRFRFTGLPLGTYCLTISRGSDVTRRTGIQVRGAQATNVPVVLGEQPPTPAVARPASQGRGLALEAQRELRKAC